MAGNTTGGKKAAETIKQKYGPDYYKVIAAKSWDNPDRNRKTGFAAQPLKRRQELARMGGQKSKRPPKTHDVEGMKYELQ